MPEGHTIHRIARDHNKDFKGQKLIVTSPQGRFS
ncbi:MAG: Fpg/Nei family DNA glycosylase, partial [Planctomycetota bacterium]